MGYAKRVDGNQKSLTEALRKLNISVGITSMVSKGFPDLVAGYNGRNYLFEIKDPEQPKSAQKLTPDEIKFHEIWNGQINTVTTLEEILNIIEYESDKNKGGLSKNTGKTRK